MLDAGGGRPGRGRGADRLPGAEEVLALLELRRTPRPGDWDVVVVDCAPTAETLRLLALPEALGWYIDRVLPVERRVVRALRPVLSRAAGVPMPSDPVFDALERLHAELDEVHTLLTGPDSSVRLVLTPEAVVLAEARRACTTLSLFGYRVDGVIANRVFPSAGADDWRAGWVLAQAAVLAEVERVVRPAAAVAVGVPRGRARRRGALAAWPRGVRRRRPAGRTGGDGPFRVTRDGLGAVLHLALPLVSRADVDLARTATSWW